MKTDLDYIYRASGGNTVPISLLTKAARTNALIEREVRLHGSATIQDKSNGSTRVVHGPMGYNASRFIVIPKVVDK